MKDYLEKRISRCFKSYLDQYYYVQNEIFPCIHHVFPYLLLRETIGNSYICKSKYLDTNLKLMTVSWADYPHPLGCLWKFTGYLTFSCMKKLFLFFCGWIPYQKFYKIWIILTIWRNTGCCITKWANPQCHLVKHSRDLGTLIIGFTVGLLLLLPE